MTYLSESILISIGPAGVEDNTQRPRHSRHHPAWMERKEGNILVFTALIKLYDLNFPPMSDRYPGGRKAPPSSVITRQLQLLQMIRRERQRENSVFNVPMRYQVPTMIYRPPDDLVDAVYNVLRSIYDVAFEEELEREMK
ncbi:hypothetical protein QR680_007516 [Steinernema hermaphroditum]|uniref:Uncharacterized protein n=1 Tax=Steinernema hermaphroditum TaxID=289476 RepID=A0AA39M6I5_9BILA|nr:hypothetical protein QR680_007516 [Steinernema hermaphroditum]